MGWFFLFGNLSLPLFCLSVGRLIHHLDDTDDVYKNERWRETRGNLGERVPFIYSQQGHDSVTNGWLVQW